MRDSTGSLTKHGQERVREAQRICNEMQTVLTPSCVAFPRSCPTPNQQTAERQSATQLVWRCHQEHTVAGTNGCTPGSLHSSHRKAMSLPRLAGGMPFPVALGVTCTQQLRKGQQRAERMPSVCRSSSSSSLVANSNLQGARHTPQLPLSQARAPAHTL